MANANNADANSKGGGSFLYVLVLIGVAVAILATVRRREPSLAPQHVGLPLPPMNVEGWLNTDGPLRDDALRGKVVLIDCWFVGCPPCRASMPHLAEFYQRHRDSGLVLIGLTPDTGAEASEAAAFVESVPGVDWPIGLGAEMPLGMLGIEAYPTLILFNKAGVSTWAGHDTAGLEEAVARAMAEKEPLAISR